MKDARLARLQSIEVNAWRNYQEARRKAQEKRTASRLDAVIEAGAKWERNNHALHDYLERLEYAKRRELWPVYA